MLLADGRIISTSRYDSTSSIGTSSYYYINTFDENGAADTSDLSMISGTVDLSISLDNQSRLLAAMAGSNALESVLRLTTSGEPDTTFGKNGNATFSPPASLSSASGSAAPRVQKDGKIIVLSTGISQATGQNVVVVSRLCN